MQAQSTTVIVGSVGIVPAAFDARTALELLPQCLSAFTAVSGGTVAVDSLRQFLEATRDASGVVISYCDGKGEVSARVLWPMTVSVTKEKRIVARCYDTRHRAFRTFRVDRVVSAHPLTLPDDAEPQEQILPNPACIAVRLGQTLVTLSHAAHLDAAEAALLADAVDDARRLHTMVAAA